MDKDPCQAAEVLHVSAPDPIPPAPPLDPPECTHLCKGDDPLRAAEDEVEVAAGERATGAQATECLLRFFADVGVPHHLLRSAVHLPFGL